jgi:hypothetical protein
LEEGTLKTTVKQRKRPFFASRFAAWLPYQNTHTQIPLLLAWATPGLAHCA